MSGLFGLLLGLPGLAEKLLAYLARRQDNATLLEQARIGADQAVIAEQLRAQVEAQKVAAAARVADRGSLWTAWMLPTAFGVSVLHYGAVILDSLPIAGHVIGSWRIPALPAPYDAMQSQIILATAGIVGVVKAARIFTR